MMTWLPFLSNAGSGVRKASLRVSWQRRKRWWNDLQCGRCVGPTPHGCPRFVPRTEFAAAVYSAVVLL
jgi:hypothetical protein